LEPNAAIADRRTRNFFTKNNGNVATPRPALPSTAQTAQPSLVPAIPLMREQRSTALSCLRHLTNCLLSRQLIVLALMTKSFVPIVPDSGSEICHAPADSDLSGRCQSAKLALI